MDEQQHRTESRGGKDQHLRELNCQSDQCGDRLQTSELAAAAPVACDAGAHKMVKTSDHHHQPRRQSRQTNVSD